VTFPLSRLFIDKQKNFECLSDEQIMIKANIRMINLRLLFLIGMVATTGVIGCGNECDE